MVKYTVLHIVVSTVGFYFCHPHKFAYCILVQSDNQTHYRNEGEDLSKGSLHWCWDVHIDWQTSPAADCT